MRSIGAAELALEMMVERSIERKAFGKQLNQHGTIRDWIARSRIEIDQARLLVRRTAWMIDKVGAKAARKEISMIKALVPGLYTTVCDRAMQVFGAMGISPMGEAALDFAAIRTDVARKSRSPYAAQKIVDCVQAALTKSFDDALASTIGLRNIVRTLDDFASLLGNAQGYWTPSKLLVALAESNGSFAAR